MYCFNFFKNQLWKHLISYNSSRNINMCLLKVDMYEKCRSSHFQSEDRGGGCGSKTFDYWGELGGYQFWGGGNFALEISTSLNAMMRQCIFQCLIQKKFWDIDFSWVSWVILRMQLYNNTYSGLKCVLCICDLENYKKDPLLIIFGSL